MSQLQRVQEDLSNWYKFDFAESKIRCDLKHGLKVGWYFDSDAEFWRREKMEPRVECQYSGLIVARPDIEPSGELYAGDCILIVTSYPCEKENPRTDYIALVRLLACEDLVELFAEEP